MYQDLKSGYSSHVNTESLSSDSLAYKIINASTIGFPGSLENSIKATLLEVYAV
jgi:hypothetical protein